MSNFATEIILDINNLNFYDYDKGRHWKKIEEIKLAISKKDYEIE